jgi:hypothetical protein
MNTFFLLGLVLAFISVYLTKKQNNNKQRKGRTDLHITRAANAKTIN